MILKHLMSGALISEKARGVDPSHSPFTSTLGRAGDPAAGSFSLAISSERASRLSSAGRSESFQRGVGLARALWQSVDAPESLAMQLLPSAALQI